MRTTLALICFRIMALIVMLLGVIQFIANFFLVVGEERPGMFGFGTAGGWWFAIFQILYPPILIISVGAILFVLVEIALRLGRPLKDSPFPFER